MRKAIGSVVVGCVGVTLSLGGVNPLVADAAPQLAASVTKATAKAKKPEYKNCTALHKKYKHGVGKSGAKDKVKGKTKPVTNFKKSTKIYNEAMKANRGLDRDKDGIACEKH